MLSGLYFSLADVEEELAGNVNICFRRKHFLCRMIVSAGACDFPNISSRASEKTQSGGVPDK